MAYESDWEPSAGVGFGQDVLHGLQSCPAKLADLEVTAAMFRNSTTSSMTKAEMKSEITKQQGGTKTGGKDKQEGRGQRNMKY